MVLNIHLIGKLRKGIMALAAGLALAGCNEANAEDNGNSNKAEVQQAAVVIETAKVTRDQCIALATKTEKIKCMKTLKAQRAAEIATLDTAIEKEKQEGKKLDTTIKVLTEIRDEAFEDEPIR